ncbi:MAG: polyprenyl synthetase family protein [Candidatus Bathyarchaeota archaeon]|jgi:geranylgeranyl pyrophosphate synthase|nr:MAG: polyprenyl synthetase family protein [Candidatus Bathyarchaeota archaeon]
MKIRSSPEERENLRHKIDRLLRKEGKEGWEMAKDTMLNNKTENRQLHEAIRYVMLKSSPDYFRPAILSFCSKITDGTSEVTIPCGASLVLFARAIGIHDDIIDQSRTKNQQTTVLGAFGKAMALILSDVLLFKGFTLLRKMLEIGVPNEKIVRIFETIEEVWFEQSQGEVLEVSSQGKHNMNLEECLRKIKMRASEMEAITRIGAILGSGSRYQIEALGEYGRLFGVASIIRDELIDMLDFRSLRHRIRKESLPLPLIFALQNPRIKSELLPLLTMKRRLLKGDLLRISRLAETAGGLSFASAHIEDVIEKAHTQIDMFGDKESIYALRLLGNSLFLDPEEWKHHIDD